MAVIISHRIKRREFKKGIISPCDLGIVLGAVREGIFTLHTYLDLLESDIENGRIDIYKI